ncbi:unnamed protein product [Orchesella dallaii]|uniref:Transmembrane protein n=1 Tax=Orchesella dallaii TaxID=48710 RepID=A0ABP1QVY9_9HEXA
MDMYKDPCCGLSLYRGVKVIAIIDLASAVFSTVLSGFGFLIALFDGDAIVNDLNYNTTTQVTPDGTPPPPIGVGWVIFSLLAITVVNIFYMFLARYLLHATQERNTTKLQRWFDVTAVILAVRLLGYIPMLFMQGGANFIAPNWSQNSLHNLTRSSDIPGGPIPLIVHTWVKPENSDGTTLQNGTVIYYVAGPWGGIRSSPHSSTTPPQQISGDLSDSIANSVYSTVQPNHLSHSPYTDSQAELGWQPPTIDITTPPPTKQQVQNQDGPWGHMHYGFGWPTSTKLYDNPPEVTPNPTRSQTVGNATTETFTSTVVAATTLATPKQEPTTTTVDPIAADTDARFPVSDSVRKFRRIVAQIRAITKKELQTEKKF